MKAEDIERLLREILSEQDEVGIEEMETFSEAGLLTNDRGLSLRLADGTTVHLTIQAWS